MATTTFSGPLKVGTVREGAGTNTGGVVLSQTATIGFADTPDATSAVATTIVLPANAQIVEQYFTVTGVWDSTLPAGEIGTVIDPDAYGDIADLTALGRTTVSPDATQAAALLDIGTSDVTDPAYPHTTVYATVTQTGVPSTGAATLTITYRQV